MGLSKFKKTLAMLTLAGSLALATPKLAVAQDFCIGDDCYVVVPDTLAYNPDNNSSIFVLGQIHGALDTANFTKDVVDKQHIIYRGLEHFHLIKNFNVVLSEGMKDGDNLESILPRNMSKDQISVLDDELGLYTLTKFFLQEGDTAPASALIKLRYPEIAVLGFEDESHDEAIMAYRTIQSEYGSRLKDMVFREKATESEERLLEEKLEDFMNSEANYVRTLRSLQKAVDIISDAKVEQDLTRYNVVILMGEVHLQHYKSIAETDTLYVGEGRENLGFQNALKNYNLILFSIENFYKE